MTRSHRQGLALAFVGLVVGGVLVATQADAQPSAAAPLDGAVLVRHAKAAKHPAASRSHHRWTRADSKRWAKDTMARRYDWGAGEFECLDAMWMHESEWRTDADDHDGGYTWGIPQARPASKMRTAGADWRTNPRTQIRWGLGYIADVYGTPCEAWGFWQDHHWY